MNVISLYTKFIKSIIGKEDIANVLNIAFDFKNLRDIYKIPIHPDRNYITCNYYLKKEIERSK